MNIESSGFTRLNGVVHLPTTKIQVNSSADIEATGFVLGSFITNSSGRLGITPQNYLPKVPGETYAQIPVEGEGQGVASSDSTDVERVASSEGVPYLVQ